MREIYLWIIGSYVSSSSLTHPLFSSVVFHSSFPTSLSVSLLLVYFRSVWGLTSVGCLTCLSHLVICLHPFATSCFFLHLLRFLPSLFISLLTNSSVAPTLSPFSHVQGNIERRHKSLSDFEDICPPPSFIRVPARPPPRPAACRNLSTQIRCFQNGDYCHCSLRHIILYKKRRLAVYVSVCVL